MSQAQTTIEIERIKTSLRFEPIRDGTSDGAATVEAIQRLTSTGRYYVIPHGLPAGHAKSAGMPVVELNGEKKAILGIAAR